MAIPLVAGAVSLVSSAVVKMLVDRVLFFLAIKALLTALFIVVAPIVIKNIIFDLMEIAFQAIDAQAVGASAFDGGMHFTGFLAWLLDKLAIPGIISLLVSAFQLHLLLKMLPFSPVK